MIAGELKGRPLLAPRGWSVRPTSDRVREATFSALGEIEGARVADLFCGTGALGIEAISRGAEHATFVDRDTRAVFGNVEALGLRERSELIRADVTRWLKRLHGEGEHVLAGEAAYDLVFCDPPYRLADALGPQLDTRLPGLLAEGGRLIFESPASRPMRIGSLKRLRQRRYGGTDISIYAKAGTERR